MSTSIPDPVAVFGGGRDVGEAVAMFTTGYNGTDLHAFDVDPHFSWAHTAFGTTDMTVRTCRFGAGLEGTVEPLDEFVVSWFASGTGILDRGRSDITVTDHRPVIFPAGRPFQFRYTAFDQRLLQIGSSYLQQVAESAGQKGPLRFDHTVRISTESGQLWRHTIQLINQPLQPGPDTSPLARQEATRLAATVLLAVFPQTPTALDTQRRPKVSSPVMSAAVDYIHAHAGEPVTVHDVAAAVGVSIRVLQSSFRRDTGMTVTQYLRGVRLDKARTDLLAASPDTTVVRVATSWGFLHAGRFAAQYAERFGEHPADTLRQA